MKPQYQTKLSAGPYLSALSTFRIPPCSKVVVDTGVYLKDVMPVPVEGSVRTSGELSDVPCAMVCSRPSLAANYGVALMNAPGIVDADCEDTIKVILLNTTNYTKKIKRKTYIAQLVFVYAHRRPELVKDEDRQGGIDE